VSEKMNDEYITIRVKRLPLGSGWSEGEAVCIDTGLKGCAYIDAALVLDEPSALSAKEE
jgi:hypothetical protein